MAHQSHSPSLRRRAEEGNLDFPLLQIGRIMLDSRPGSHRNRFLEILEVRQTYVKVRVDLDEAHETHLQQGDILRPKQPAQSLVPRLFPTSPADPTHLTHFRAIDSACSSMVLASHACV